MILDQLMYSELIPDAIVKRKDHAAHFSNKQTQELKHNPASSFQYIYIYKQLDVEFSEATKPYCYKNEEYCPQNSSQRTNTLPGITEMIVPRRIGLNLL